MILTETQAEWLLAQVDRGEEMARVFGPGATGGLDVSWFQDLAELLSGSVDDR